MTTLTFASKQLYGTPVGEESAFPAMRNPVQGDIKTCLGEFDDLFIGYGAFHDTLPYQMQDGYDALPAQICNYPSVILENKHLRAEFLPSLGARLWCLYDKDAQRDLLLNNHELRIRNLAIRNAWFAGGSETNIGRFGHDVQTCSPRFCATLKDTDGSPVFRVYEFNRDRAVPFQIDFTLPEDSHFLLARVRIMNIRECVIPMYWWSNLALPAHPGSRIVVPANHTFANVYDGTSHFLKRIPLPDGEGFDATYPEHFPTARDHFYDIPSSNRKFEALVQPDGYGFLYASTRRLQGRKLFVWGQGNGGRRWQRSLVAGDCPDYLEIQGGLARTQQECLPMPPKTTWEWLEAYGAFQSNPNEAFGDWAGAVRHVTQVADALLPDAWLDAELERTRLSYATRKGEVVASGSGWGALEEMRLGHPLVAHLDFGKPGPPQDDWTALLKKREMPSGNPPSAFMIQEEWEDLLKAAPENWKRLFHEALYDYRREAYQASREKLEKSIALEKNAWNLFALANVLRELNEISSAAAFLLEALALRPFDAALAKEAFRSFLSMKVEPERFLEAYRILDEKVRKLPFVRFCHAWALAHSGKLDEAERLLCADGGMFLPDLREGENSAAELYVFIQQKKAELRGESLAPEDIWIPHSMDFSMN